MSGRTFDPPGPSGRAAADETDPSEAAQLSWDRYLDLLEQSVLAVDSAVMNGRSPGWLEAQIPEGPIPDRLRVRSQVLLALLHDVTERTQLQRDDLAAELAALPGPRPRDRARATSLGGSLDILG
jgi:hypothetical protein